jgi:hypothetical protein
MGNGMDAKKAPNFPEKKQKPIICISPKIFVHNILSDF